VSFSPSHLLASMSDFPDFSSYGYQVSKELGSNRAGGRVTYLATQTSAATHPEPGREIAQRQPATGQCETVVIKEFQFARSSGGWSGYDAYSREIEVLRGLEHPGIPKYLDSFQTESGFCMVQEYKEALPLSVNRSFSPDNVQKIAISALEILVYLQNRMPPVIHRDLKPENILVDDQMNVYIVDFGFARVGDGEVGVSSVIKGTLGFMPPEQLFNRQLSEASDLYGLGVTLICLLTKTRSDDIGNLVDISYRVSFKHLVPKLSIHWQNWLEKMVEPKVKDRFASAAAALAAMPTTPLRLPEVRFSHSHLSFKASKLGEPLTQTITLSNLVPDTLLEGRWEVAPHASDPPHTPDTHAWIAIQPTRFSGNQVSCQISVNTRKLMAERSYHRTLMLHTNSYPETYSLEIQVKTAPLPIRSLQLPYRYLGLLLLGFGITAWVLGFMLFMLSTILNDPTTVSFGALIGAAVGFQVAAWMLSSADSVVGATTAVLAGTGMGAVALICAVGLGITITPTALPAGLVLGLISGVLTGVALGRSVEQLIELGLSQMLSIGIALFTAAAGVCAGFYLVPNLFTPMLTAVAMGVGTIWVTLVAYLPLQHKKLITAYRQHENNLIKP
jgi:serine/threonine protein kinase